MVSGGGGNPGTTEPDCVCEVEFSRTGDRCPGCVDLRPTGPGSSDGDAGEQVLQEPFSFLTNVPGTKGFRCVRCKLSCPL